MEKNQVKSFGQNKKNSSDDNKKRNRIIAGVALTGVVAAVAIAVPLLVKGCTDDKSVSFKIKHANVNAAQAKNVSFEYANGATVTNLKQGTDGKYSGDVVAANSTKGTVTSGDVTGAGYGNSDSFDGSITKDAELSSGNVSGHFEGATSVGGVLNKTTTAGGNYTATDGSWKFADASFVAATFTNFFSTSGEITQNTTSGQITGTINTATNTSTSLLNIIQQEQKDTQDAIDATLNNSPIAQGSISSDPNQSNVITDVIKQSGGMVSSVVLPLAGEPNTYKVTYTPKANNNNPNPTPITVKVNVPSAPTPSQQLDATLISGPKSADENNWNKLVASDFQMIPPAGVSGIVVSKVVAPTTKPANSGPITYTATLQYPGNANPAITKDVQVEIPYVGPSQDTLDQRALDAIVVTPKTTLHESSYVSKGVDKHWTTMLSEEDFNVPSGVSIASAITNDQEPTADTTVNFTVELNKGNAHKELIVAVAFKAPTPENIAQAAMDNATVSVKQIPLVTSANKVLLNSDFAVSSSDANIKLDQNATPSASNPHDVNGKQVITYTLTLAYDNSTTNLNPAPNNKTVTVDVPYEDVLSKVNVNPSVNVNDSNWNKLGVSDFALDYGSATQKSGVAIEIVTPPTTKPAANGTLNYDVVLKLGTETKTIQVPVAFATLSINVSTAKTVNENTFDKLTKADFDLASSQIADTSLIHIKDITAGAKPTTDSGVVTYTVNWTYNNFDGSSTFNVPYGKSDNGLLDEIQVSTSKVLGWNDWDKLANPDLIVTHNDANATVQIVKPAAKPDKTYSGKLHYSLHLKLNNAIKTIPLDVDYIAPTIRHVEHWSYNNVDYTDHDQALAAAKAGEESKIQAVDIWTFNGKTYDSQLKAQNALKAYAIAQVIQQKSFDSNQASGLNDGDDISHLDPIKDIYVYNGKVYLTMDAAKQAWINDPAHANGNDTNGSVVVKYKDKAVSNTIETIVIDTQNQAVYSSEQVALQNAQGKFEWLPVVGNSTSGSAKVDEVLPSSASLPTATNNLEIKIDNKTYTYYTVGGISNSPASATQYTKADIEQAVQTASTNQDGSFKDLSTNVTVNGTQYTFNSTPVVNPPTSYTVDQLLAQLQNGDFRFNDVDYSQVVNHLKGLSVVSYDSDANLFGGLQSGQAQMLEMMKRVSPTGTPGGVILSTIFKDTIDDNKIKLNMNDSDPAFSADPSENIFAFYKDQISDLNEWVNNMLSKLQSASDLTPLDGATGNGTDSWGWYWTTFVKHLADIYNSNHSTKIDTSIFSGLHNVAQNGHIEDEDKIKEEIEKITKNVFQASTFHSIDFLFATNNPSSVTDWGKMIKDLPTEITQLKIWLTTFKGYLARIQSYSSQSNLWVVALSTLLRNFMGDPGKNLTIMTEPDVEQLFNAQFIEDAKKMGDSYVASPLPFSLKTTPNIHFMAVTHIFTMWGDNYQTPNINGTLEANLGLPSDKDQWGIEWTTRDSDFLRAAQSLNGDFLKVFSDPLSKSRYAWFTDPQTNNAYYFFATVGMEYEAEGVFPGHGVTVEQKPNPNVANTNWLALKGATASQKVDTSTWTGNIYAEPDAQYSTKASATDFTTDPTKGFGYVAAHQEWSVAIPEGTYYKKPDGTYTSTLATDVDGYVAASPLPATAGWYDETKNTIIATTAAETLQSTIYIRKNKTDADHDYVTAVGDAEGYFATIPESRIDHYALNYTKSDGTKVVVPNITSDIPYSSTGTKGQAPVIDNTNISIDFAPFQQGKSWDWSNDNGNSEVNHHLIVSGYDLVKTAPNGSVDYEASKFPESSGSNTVGYIYSNKYYKTEDAAANAYDTDNASQIVKTSPKLKYINKIYADEAAAINAADTSAAKIVDNSKTEEEKISATVIPHASSSNVDATSIYKIA